MGLTARRTAGERPDHRTMPTVTLPRFRTLIRSTCADFRRSGGATPEVFASRSGTAVSPWWKARFATRPEGAGEREAPA